MQRRWRKILQPWLLVLLLAGCDSQVILNTGLTENDANDIISELSKYKIEADKQIDKTGVTVLVAQDNIERSVRILNANGLPHKARTNLGEVFQKNGIISSPLEERARYIYALSQELESTLSQIDGVVVARVNVVLPERVAPGEPVQPASASVFIKYTPDMDPDSIEPRIRRLVAASIPGLSGKNDGALSVVFVPAAVYHDRVELVTLGPFQLTLSQYATVRALFFSLIGLLLLLGGIFTLVPKLKAMKRGKNTATTELAVVPSERRLGGIGGKPAAMFEKASGMFKQMEGDQKQMNNVLRKAARSTDPLVLNQVDDQLSNYYLESMMNAKIVSKSISGLDKLTNLQ